MTKPMWNLEDVRRVLETQNRKLAAAHDAARLRDQPVRITLESAERLEVACVPRRVPDDAKRLASSGIAC
jgi:hypothetical protein